MKTNRFNFFWYFGTLILPAFITGSCGTTRSAGNNSGANNRNNYPPANRIGSNGVDTVQWKDNPNARPPIFSSGTPNTTPSTTGNANGGVMLDDKGNPISQVPEPGMDLKASYKIALLLPFYLEKYSPDSLYPRSAFALDFYAGAKVALDSLSHGDVNLTVTALDSKTDFTNLLSRFEVAHADMVIGPVEKENIPTAAGFSTSSGIAVISPYQPTGDLLGSNPNFIQVKPSFKTHCEAITRHVRAAYRPEQIVLVSRTQDNEPARFKVFQDANNLMEKSSHSIHFAEWTVDDEANIDPSPYINAQNPTVFIVPSWNEPFVTALLKKLDASLNRKNVIVYGMPQWMDMSGMGSRFERLNVHISSSTYVDQDAPEVMDFKRKFVDRFGKLPNFDSYLGYDCTWYFANALKKYGTKFAFYLDRDPEKVLHTSFNFSPVFQGGTDNFTAPVKYENKYVNILKYYNGKFRLDSGQ